MEFTTYGSPSTSHHSGHLLRIERKKIGTELSKQFAPLIATPEDFASALRGKPPWGQDRALVVDTSDIAALKATTHLSNSV
jgi:hypothetical protein